MVVSKKAYSIVYPVVNLSCFSQTLLNFTGYFLTTVNYCYKKNKVL